MRPATGHQVPVQCVVPALTVRPARPGPGQPDRYADPGKPCHELGAGYFTRRLDPERETRRLIARLKALGHRVTLADAAA